MTRFTLILLLIIPIVGLSQFENSNFPEVIYFEATESNGRVYIKWDIFNDLLCDNIILQRSVDGQVWKNIHFKESKGNYGKTNAFHYIDTEAPAGISYYRLSFVKRGKPAIKSKINVVKIDPKGVVRCFPNPTTGALNFYIDSSEPTRGYLRIINGHGFVEHQEILEIEQGISAFKRDFSQLDAGIYIIKLDFDSGLSFSQQEIIQD